MRVFITGASGFLGRATVAAFLGHGHTVRAMVRDSERIPSVWKSNPDIQFYVGDLRRPTGLPEAIAGCDTLVHLAAAVIAPDAAHYAITVGGTENLLRALPGSSVQRLVLAGSMSVYNWSDARGTLTEATPVEERPYVAGAYASAKLWQERILVRAQREHPSWELVILRPGVIWGPGNEGLFMAGLPGNKLHLVIGPSRQMPMTFIDNCAEAFVLAATHAAPPPVVNVLDDDVLTPWRFLGEYQRRRGAGGRRVPVPFLLPWIAAHSATAISRACFGPGGKLPSILMPKRLAIYKPLRFSNALLKSGLGWRQPVDLGTALTRTFGPPVG